MGDREGAEEMKGETWGNAETQREKKDAKTVSLGNRQGEDIVRRKTSSQEEGYTRADKKRMRAELPDCQGFRGRLRDASYGA